MFLSSVLFEAGFCYVYIAQVVFNLQSSCLSFLSVRITGVHPIPAFIHSFSQSSHSSLVYIPFQGRGSRPSLIGEGWWRHFAGWEVFGNTVLAVAGESRTDVNSYEHAIVETVGWKTEHNSFSNFTSENRYQAWWWMSAILTAWAAETGGSHFRPAKATEK